MADALDLDASYVGQQLGSSDVDQTASDRAELHQRRRFGDALESVQRICMGLSRCVGVEVCLFRLSAHPIRTYQRTKLVVEEASLRPDSLSAWEPHRCSSSSSSSSGQLHAHLFHISVTSLTAKHARCPLRRFYAHAPCRAPSFALRGTFRLAAHQRQRPHPHHPLSAPFSSCPASDYCRLLDRGRTTSL